MIPSGESSSLPFICLSLLSWRISSGESQLKKKTLSGHFSILCVIKDVEHILRNYKIHLGVDLLSSMSPSPSLGILWPPCIRIVIRVAFSVFNVYAFFRACWGKTSSNWAMIGTTGVPLSGVISSLFSKPSTLSSVAILGTDTFFIVTGNVLFVVLWINGENLRRYAEKTMLWATWSLRVALTFWRSITFTLMC